MTCSVTSRLTMIHIVAASMIERYHVLDSFTFDSLLATYTVLRKVFPGRQTYVPHSAAWLRHFTCHESPLPLPHWNTFEYWIMTIVPVWHHHTLLNWKAFAGEMGLCIPGSNATILTLSPKQTPNPSRTSIVSVHRRLFCCIAQAILEYDIWTP